jgi:hypothetical protein
MKRKINIYVYKLGAVIPDHYFERSKKANKLSLKRIKFSKF